MVLWALTLLVSAAPARADFEFLTQWGAPKPGELVAPFDVERDAAGNAYVVDFVNRGVHKFDAANSPILSWGSAGSGPGQFTFTFAIGLNAATGEVYVADFGGTDAASVYSRIQRFDANGALLGEFGSFGTAEGQLAAVRGISVDASGNVFVADSGNNRIQQFTATGQFVRMWGKDVTPGGAAGFEECLGGCKQGEPGTAEGEFDFPTDVAASGFGVFVSDGNNNRLQRFNLAGGQVNFLTMGGRDVVPGGGGGYETCSASCKQGDTGSQDGEMSGPVGLDVNAVPPARVWAVDGGNDRVQRYNAGLAFEAKFGSTGSADGQFDTPDGLAEGGDQVIVADTRASRFQRFDGVAGAFQSKSAPPDDNTLISPTAVGAASGGVYVADQRPRVARFDSGGAFLGSWGQEGTGPGQFLVPDGVAGDAGGNVYVADRGTNRIQRFDADGDLLGAWGSSGTATGEFDGPVDVAIAPDGSVFVVEEGNDRVQKFNAIGGFLGTWGAEGAAEGQFDDPSGIATDDDGNVYVADRGNDRVQKFDSQGTFLTTWGSEGSGDGQFRDPSDVAADSVGNVFVSERENHRVQRFDANGTFLGRWGANGGDGTPGAAPGEFFFPSNLTVDDGGDIFVLDGGNGRVQKFAGAEGSGMGAAAPELGLQGRRRQKAGRLKLEVGCGNAPCTVELAGRVVAKRRSAKRDSGAGPRAEHRAKRRRVARKLKPTEATLATGETAVVRLKLRRHRRSVRVVNRFLRHASRGKAVVRGKATNAGGSDADKARVKLKRPR